MNRSSLILLGAGVALALAAPAPAFAKSCGTVKGVGGGTTVTNVATTSGSCVVAKTVAKAYARTQGRNTSEHLCRYATAGKPLGARYRVSCTRSGRKITFTVRFPNVVLLPPLPALPQVGG